VSVRRIAAVAVCVAFESASPRAAADVVVPAGAEMSLDAGGLALGCTDLIVAGTLHVGAAAVTDVRNFVIQPGGVVDATTGTISVGGTFTNLGTFSPGSGGVVFGNACGSGPAASIPVPATSGRGLLLLAALLGVAAFLSRRGPRSWRS
jgi:hypothetical protein